MAHADIALALGISRPTLHKHFAQELSVGAMQKRGEVMDAVMKAAKKGNVAAARLYLSLNPDAGTVPVEKPKGKKDQAQETAKTAEKGTDWEDLLGPKVVSIKR